MVADMCNANPPLLGLRLEFEAAKASQNNDRAACPCRFRKQKGEETSTNPSYLPPKTNAVGKGGKHAPVTPVLLYLAPNYRRYAVVLAGSLTT